MIFKCQAFLFEGMGTRVERRECGSLRKAIRWANRQLARHEFRRRSAEIRDARGELVWAGQKFWPTSLSESAESIAAAQGVTR